MANAEQSLPTVPAQPFRLDVPLHSLLQHGSQRSATISPGEPAVLPTAVFPQHPELLHELDAADIAAHDHVLNTGKRQWPASLVFQNMTGLLFPYFKSIHLPRGFPPILSSLFTDVKCNL